MEAGYQSFKARWLARERNRELCLRVMFFAWMHWADPPFVTGLAEDAEAERLWREAFDHMGGEESADAEFLFAAGVMAGLFPYGLGAEDEWLARGSRMKSRALQSQPGTLPLGTFDDRDEYGRYFSHQLRGHLAAR